MSQQFRQGEMTAEVRPGKPDGWVWEVRRDVRDQDGGYIGNELLASGGAPKESFAWMVVRRALDRAVRVEALRAQIKPTVAEATGASL